MDFPCCPFKQSVVENGRVPTKQLLRGRGDTSRRAVRLSPSVLDSRHAGVRRLQQLRRATPPVHVPHRPPDAYDSVDRELLWSLLARFGVPEKMLIVPRAYG